MNSRVDSFYNASRRIMLDDVPRLEGALDADVVIVGGGITGCSAALELAERGHDVALLEARHIGWGASGRSGGQILNGYSTDLDVIARSIGMDAARQAWEMSREAVQLVKERIDRYAIPCDWHEGSIHAAVKERHAKAIKADSRHMRDTWGYDKLQWLDRDALAERVCTTAYVGGCRDPESGHLHPLDYTCGVARAAREAGAKLFEDSAVIKLEPGQRPRVTTANGEVRADFVILAGNAYLGGDIAPQLRGRTLPIYDYIVATEPLSDTQVAHTLPHNDAVYDSNALVDYYHLSGDRRMLYGGQASYGSKPRRNLRQHMATRLQRLFPSLDGIAIDYHWNGSISITFERTPDLGRITPNIYFAQGFSGHGMALGGFSGKLMAEVIAGQTGRFDLYTKLKHRMFPGGERMRVPLLMLGMTFYRLRDML